MDTSEILSLWFHYISQGVYYPISQIFMGGGGNAKMRKRKHLGFTIVSGYWTKKDMKMLQIFFPFHRLRRKFRRTSPSAAHSSAPASRRLVHRLLRLSLTPSAPAQPGPRAQHLGTDLREPSARAGELLMVLGDRLAGAEAVLLVVPFPQDVAVLLHLSWRPACCWRGAADNNDGGRGADLRKLGGYLLVPLLD